MSNIKENILRMKDMSEIMTDLAYSALFLHDRKISAEVSRMDKEVQQLEEDTLKMLFKVRESGGERITILNITGFIRNISNSAVQISNLVESERLPSIIKDILKESDKRVLTETIVGKSPLVGRTIGGSRVEIYTKARILAINRKKKWVFEVNDDTRLMNKDLLVAVGNVEAEKILKDVANGKIKKI